MTDKPTIDVRALLRGQTEKTPAVSPTQSDATVGSGAKVGGKPSPPKPAPQRPNLLVTQRVRLEHQRIRHITNPTIEFSNECEKVTYLQDNGTFTTSDNSPSIELPDGEVVKDLKEVLHNCPRFKKGKPRKFCGPLKSPYQCRRCKLKFCRSHVWMPIFSKKVYCGRCLMLVILESCLKGSLVAVVFTASTLTAGVKWIIDSFKEPR
ncbi:MAG: hypothetical protein IT462_11635 [Planctomycetes bacterium]|nr:hypothetical protein [Planctomycetota bacterium]